MTLRSHRDSGETHAKMFCTQPNSTIEKEFHPQSPHPIQVPPQQQLHKQSPSSQNSSLQLSSPFYLLGCSPSLDR